MKLSAFFIGSLKSHTTAFRSISIFINNCGKMGKWGSYDVAFLIVVIKLASRKLQLRNNWRKGTQFLALIDQQFGSLRRSTVGWVAATNIFSNVAKNCAARLYHTDFLRTRPCLCFTTTDKSLMYDFASLRSLYRDQRKLIFLGFFHVLIFARSHTGSLLPRIMYRCKIIRK